MYEEEYAAHEASMTENRYLYASGSKMYTITPQILEKELDGFETAKQRVIYLKERIKQIELEQKEFVSALQNLRISCGTYQQTEREIKEFNSHGTVNGVQIPYNFSNESDWDNPYAVCFWRLKEISDAAKVKIDHIRKLLLDRYCVIAFGFESVEENYGFIIERFQSHIRLLQTAQKYWELYATVESEAPMPIQPSTPEQPSIHWKAAQADLVELAYALFEANVASLPDNSSKDEFTRRFALLFGEQINNPNSHVQGTLKHREPASFLDKLKDAYLGKVQAIEKRSKARRKAPSKKS